MSGACGGILALSIGIQEFRLGANALSDFGTSVRPAHSAKTGLHFKFLWELVS